MKYFKKQKRLFNCCILIIIVYFLNTYDILNAITLKSQNYFWQASKTVFGSFSDILKALNTFTYLSKGILAGAIVYLGSAYRIVSESKNYDLFFQNKNCFKSYLKEWSYSFKVIAIIMLSFTAFFSFWVQKEISSILTLVLLLINMFLYVVFLNELSLILRRKIKWLNNIRYLVETISFSVILLEIVLARFMASLYFNTEFINTLILIVMDFVCYEIIKKNAYFQRKYNCLYITYGIK